MFGAARTRAGLVATVTVLVIAGTVAGLGPAVGEEPAVGAASFQTDDRPAAAWNATFGRSGDDAITAVAAGGDGRYLLAGGTATADGGRDGWLMLVDGSGDRQFATTVGGTGRDRISDAVWTGDGYLLAGWRAVGGSTQGWLLKVDERGVEQWNRTLGGPQWDGFWTLARGADGDYVAVGRLQFEAWAVKFDGEGDVAWSHTYASRGNGSTFEAVAPTDDGVLLAGWADPANASAVGLAVRVNGSGSEQWSRSYDADDGTRVRAAEATDGGYVLAGETDPADGPSRAWARFIDGNGSVESQWTDDSSDSRFVDAVPLDDGILLVGGANGSGSYDALATRFGDGLERRWAVTAGGPQWDVALSGIAAGDGYLLAGATTSSGAGGQDGWLVKLNGSAA